jgi:hypothetical protein
MTKRVPHKTCNICGLDVATTSFKKVRDLPRAFIITKRQHYFGVTAGEHGVRGYEWRLLVSDRIENALFGMALDVLLGEELGDGSTVRVTVEVLTRKKPTKNPWLRRRR